MDMLFPISNKYFGWLSVTWVEEKGFRRVTQKMNEKYSTVVLSLLQGELKSH